MWRPLDLDHARSGISHPESGQGSRQKRREVEDQHALERVHVRLACALATCARRAGQQARIADRGVESLADVKMSRQPRALCELDRSYWITEAEPHRQIQVIGGCKLFVQRLECGIEVRPEEPVKDSAWEVVDNRRGQPGSLKDLLCHIQRVRVSSWLANQLHKLGWCLVTQPETIEPEHVGSLGPAVLAGMHAQAFCSQLHQHR